MVVFLAATVLILVIEALWVSKQAAYYTDPVVYLTGARSLAMGEGYRFACFLAHPPIGTYPPMQSAWLSLSYLLEPQFPENLPLLHAQMLILSGCALLFMQLYLRRMGSPVWAAVLTAAAWGTTGRWLTQINVFLSDVGFTAIIFGLMYLWTVSPSPARRANWLLTGLLLAVACLWRIPAIAMIGVALMVAAWRAWRDREWFPGLIVGIPSIGVLVGWKWMSRNAIGYEPIIAYLHQQLGGIAGYIGYLGEVGLELASGQTFWDLLCEAFAFMPYVFDEKIPAAGPLAHAASTGFWLAIATLVAYGFWKIRTRPWTGILLAISGLYVAQVLVSACNPAQYARYMQPLALIPAGWLIVGLANLPPAVRRISKPLIAGVLLAALALNLRYTPKTLRLWETAIPLGEVNEVASFIRQSVPTNALIAIDYRLPVEQLSTSTGREFIADYFNPSAAMTPVQHHQQGNPPAAYVVTCPIVAPWDFGAYEAPTNFPVVFRSSGGIFKIARVPEGITPSPAIFVPPISTPAKQRPDRHAGGKTSTSKTSVP